ncbi:hypothetical protein SAMN05421811_103215 [Nonomuraea wenchangensis]|uniref:Uncharacterized protein n=2 Tax=Nonomuraea wenchangensis TaxID=568860 RepID=A0A1I0EV90_9ACTN|nr:hypothetical protein SAMN05421811_103215 [Nonomuraea wenchangensis]
MPDDSTSGTSMRSWITSALIVFPPIFAVAFCAAYGWKAFLPVVLVAYLLVMAVLDPFRRH